MNRYALCVGINDYPGTAADLSGCVNDAWDWAQVLENRGYTTRVMLDDSATKANVLAHLRYLVEMARWRDRIVFCYSGHGTWVPDKTGDELDGRDEALVMYDYNQGGLITDDDLHELFSGARFGVTVTVLSDSCHSGTVARDLMALSSAQGHKKFVSPAVIDSVPVDREQAISLETKIVKARSRVGAMLISGCNDPEYSYDANFGGRPNGAFTRVAIDALLHTNPKNMKAWHAEIRRHLPSAEYPQSPQLGATAFQKRKAPLS